MYNNNQYIKRNLCVCLLYFIVNTIWMPTSILTGLPSFAIIMTFSPYCSGQVSTRQGSYSGTNTKLHEVQYLSSQRLQVTSSYYDLPFRPYTLFLNDFIYTALVKKRTNFFLYLITFSTSVGQVTVNVKGLQYVGSCTTAYPHDAFRVPLILRSCIQALHAIPIRFHLYDYSVKTY